MWIKRQFFVPPEMAPLRRIPGIALTKKKDQSRSFGQQKSEIALTRSRLRMPIKP
jgi:hypothetical protein